MNVSSNDDFLLSINLCSLRFSEGALLVSLGCSLTSQFNELSWEGDFQSFSGLKAMLSGNNGPAVEENNPPRAWDIFPEPTGVLRCSRSAFGASLALSKLVTFTDRLVVSIAFIGFSMVFSTFALISGWHFGSGGLQTTLVCRLVIKDWMWSGSEPSLMTLRMIWWVTTSFKIRKARSVFNTLDLSWNSEKSLAVCAST